IHTADQAESHDQPESNDQPDNYHQPESHDQPESYDQPERYTADEGEPIGLYSGEAPESSPEKREVEPIAEDAPGSDRLAARRAGPETAREAADILSGAVRSTSQFIRERDQQSGSVDPVLARAIADIEGILEVLRQPRQEGEPLPAELAGEESDDASLDPSEDSGGDEDSTVAPLPLDALLSDLPGSEQDRGKGPLRRWKRSK
ncbi:MAG: hypothetical protein H0U16_00135, partial [Actinobacteria bacterium]|nr:hypothetical protein [Actinomycetota bacterium]